MSPKTHSAFIFVLHHEKSNQESSYSEQLENFEFTSKRDGDLLVEFPGVFTLQNNSLLGNHEFKNQLSYTNDFNQTSYCILSEELFNKIFEIRLMQSKYYYNLNEYFEGDYIYNNVNIIKKCYITKVSWECFICLHLEILLKKRYDKKHYKDCFHVVHENCARMYYNLIKTKCEN